MTRDEWIVLGMVAALLIIVAGWAQCRHSLTARRIILNTCCNNLRLIHAAKCQYCMKMGIKNSEPINVVGVNDYIKGNTTPVCPAGGIYTYQNAGVDPRCSIHGTVNEASYKWAKVDRKQPTDPPQAN